MPQFLSKLKSFSTAVSTSLSVPEVLYTAAYHDQAKGFIITR